jgi:hypothetical protein
MVLAFAGLSTITSWRPEACPALYPAPDRRPEALARPPEARAPERLPEDFLAAFLATFLLDFFAMHVLSACSGALGEAVAARNPPVSPGTGRGRKPLSTPAVKRRRSQTLPDQSKTPG